MLIAAVVCLAGAVAPALAAGGDLVTLELRLRPDSKPANPNLPATVRMKVPRDNLNFFTTPDDDGIYRRAGFLLSFRDDPATNLQVRLDVRGPADRDLAKKIPKPGVSPPVPGFRAFENPDSATTPLFAIEDPEFGVVIAFCVSLGDGPPKFCEFDTAMAPELIVGTHVDGPDFSSWRNLVKVSRERVRPLIQ
jgi:hypothetical protein